MRDQLNKLELSNEAVLLREHKREAAYGKVGEAEPHKAVEPASYYPFVEC